MNTIFDPRGNPTVLVDQMIGQAYPTVRFVASNMEYIKHVSHYMPQLYSVIENIEFLENLIVDIPELKVIYDNITIFNNIYDNLSVIGLVNTNLNALVTLNSNTSILLEARDDILAFAQSFGSVQAVLDATAADALKTGQDRTAVEAVHTAFVNADVLGQMDYFRGTWLGEQSTDPTTDLNGDALTGGEVYTNSVTGKFRAYNSLTGWSDAGAVSSNLVPFRINGNGTAGPYTLPETPLSKAHLILYVGGLPQDGQDYTLVGNQVTAGANVPGTSRLSGLIINPLASGQPGNETVGAAQINTAQVPAIKAKLGIQEDTSLASQIGLLQSYWMPANLELSELSQKAMLIGMDSGNGIFDGLNTLDLVDVANALNMDISTVGLIKPTSSSNVSSTAWSGSQDADATGWTNYNVRMFYHDTILNNNGSSIRVQLTGPVTGSSVITGMVIGQRNPAGDNFDFASAPAPITVGGNAAFTLAAGSVTWSDWINFSFNADLGHIIAYHQSSGNARRMESADANQLVYTKVADSEITTLDVTGYALSGTSHNIVNNIESRVTGAPNLLTVESKDITLSEVPDWGRVIAFVIKNGAVTNTDLKFKLSSNADDFGVLPMVEKFTRADGSVMLDSGMVNLTAINSGLLARWRIETLNAKSPSILAIGTVFGVNN